MGLLPMGMEILPPSDDRVFKLLLASEETKPALINLLSCITGRNVVNATVQNSELPAEDTHEKAERLDLNCIFDDADQADIEMQASHMKEDRDGQHKNLKGKSVYYGCDMHSSQSAKGLYRYDKLARTYQITFVNYTIFPDEPDKYVHTFSIREDATGELLTDAIQFIFIELSKLQKVLKKPVSEMTDLDKWAFFYVMRTKKSIGIL